MPFTPPRTSLHFYPKDTSPKTGLALSATQTAVGVLAYFAAAIGCLAAVISLWYKLRQRRHRRGDLYELEAVTSRYVPLLDSTNIVNGVSLHMLAIPITLNDAIKITIYRRKIVDEVGDHVELSIVMESR
jgi:hypothetical protein